ncbi:MAG: DEAD/DEAH box helicase family protein [Candidatus Saccharimonadales bacterium]
MTLNEFMDLHGSKMGFLETTFLKNIFYEDYGDSGLEMIEPEVNIPRNDGSERTWRIDFIVTTSNGKYAVECDGFNYHAAGMVSRERFNELESKRNETIRQGYTVISLSKDQIVDDPESAIYELRRFFNSDPDLYSLFLGWNGHQITPHEVQKNALTALETTRKEGNERGLVVMATGLGKTYLGIFDARAMHAKKILFIVHQDHILKQAKNSFEKVMPERSDEMGFFTGKEKSYGDKNIVFATIQTISREDNLHTFSQEHFDYIIIDESHHTAANSYRKVSDYFSPKFFLGLTATPDRMDEQSILEYYGDNLVFEMGQSEAIRQGYLANLNYIGLLDNVDYSNIFYNGFRYDVNDLNKLLLIEGRDKAVLSKFKSLAPDKKTIAFCVSIEHADWSAQKFRESGIDAIAIHSKVEDSHTEGAYQSASEIIDAFDKGKHQVVFVVDMLNEGIDIPDVECLLMLRPTESNTILTQQLGRGLRLAKGKKEVLVLDFIGNYRTAPKILTGLGVGISELEHDAEKGIYYYDNDGRRVMFQDEVVDIFRFMASRNSRKVRDELISEEWNEYAEYLKDNTSEGKNLYWSIGKKNNDINMHLWALEFANENHKKYSNNVELDSAMKLAWKSTHGDKATMEGIRALFFSKLIGLIVDTSPFKLSAAYYEVVKHLENDDRDGAFGIISSQLEKFHFWNDISALVNRHAEHGERREVDKLFRIYPLFFIYQVILRLVDKGYEDMKITKFELENFVFIARSHDDLEDCVSRIVSYREYEERYELEKLIRQSSNMDSRLYKTLALSKYFIFAPEFLSVNTALRNEFASRVEIFNELLANGKLTMFDSSNPTRYRDMLYSQKDIITYHEKS